MGLTLASIDILKADLQAAERCGRKSLNSYQYSAYWFP